MYRAAQHSTVKLCVSVSKPRNIELLQAQAHVHAHEHTLIMLKRPTVIKCSDANLKCFYLPQQNIKLNGNSLFLTITEL